MARPSPQSFEKRQREIRKRRKREEKLERRLWRNEEKRIAKEEGEYPPAEGYVEGDAETGAEGPGEGPADGAAGPERESPRAREAEGDTPG